MPLLLSSFGESLSVDVVAHDRVVELGVPVDLHRARDVAGLVQQHVLVGFDHDQARSAEALCEPLGGHESAGFGVFGELGRSGVELDGHRDLLRR